MSKSEFSLKSVEVLDNSIFGKIRKVYGEEVEVIKTFSTEPVFIGKENPKMIVADDGTKCCFMFNGFEKANEFATCLSERLGVNRDVGSFIGYGTVYVPVDHYEEAIQKGVNCLLANENGYWVDFYNERKRYDYEPIIALAPHENCYNKEGYLKKAEEIVIRMWLKKLERTLEEEILFDKSFGRIIEVGIRRKHDAHLRHGDVLNKIRMTNLLKKSPFEGYAYIDYYGKYVK